MSGHINFWMDEADFQYVLYILNKQKEKIKREITFTVSDYIPDFYKNTDDESLIKCVYLPGHPKNPTRINQEKTFKIQSTTK